MPVAGFFKYFKKSGSCWKNDLCCGECILPKYESEHLCVLGRTRFFPNMKDPQMGPGKASIWPFYLACEASMEQYELGVTYIVPFPKPSTIHHDIK